MQACAQGALIMPVSFTGMTCLGPNAAPRSAPINPRSCAEPQCRLCARTRRSVAPNTTRAGSGAEYAASSRKVALIGAETPAPPASPAPAAAAPSTNALTRQDCASGSPIPKALIPGGAVAGIPRRSPPLAGSAARHWHSAFFVVLVFRGIAARPASAPIRGASSPPNRGGNTPLCHAVRSYRQGPRFPSSPPFNSSPLLNCQPTPLPNPLTKSG